MTQEQFNQCTKSLQRNLLLTKGSFLDERQSRNHDVMLYELDGFYAEAYFVKNTNKAVFFKSFTDTNLLEPYLTRVDISELINLATH